MLLMGCQSTKIDYVVPELDFPEFPLAEEIINNNDGTCTVSSDWIIKLRLYQIDIERCKKDYQKLKELYGGENESSADVGNRTE